MSKKPLNFTSIAERQNWLIKNAELFTVIRRRNRRYERTEYPTLKAAEQAAEVMLIEDPTARLLIYAVHDQNDTFVKTVFK